MGLEPADEVSAAPPPVDADEVHGAALDLLRAVVVLRAPEAPAAAAGRASPPPRACASAQPHVGRMSLAKAVGEKRGLATSAAKATDQGWVGGKATRAHWVVA